MAVAAVARDHHETGVHEPRQVHPPARRVAHRAGDRRDVRVAFGRRFG